MMTTRMLNRATRSGRPHERELAAVMDVTDANVDAFLSAERSALILTDPGATFASTMRADLDHLMQAEKLAGVRFGVLDLTAPTSECVRQLNPWRETISALPYVTLHRDGRRVDGFVAYRAATVIARMGRLAFLPQPGEVPVVPNQDYFSPAAD